MLADSESVLELGKYGKLQLLVSFRVTASLALNKDRRLIGMGGTFWQGILLVDWQPTSEKVTTASQQLRWRGKDQERHKTVELLAFPSFEHKPR